MYRKVKQHVNNNKRYRQESEAALARLSLAISFPDGHCEARSAVAIFIIEESSTGINLWRYALTTRPLIDNIANEQVYM
jgi:hypothetical protein